MTTPADRDAGPGADPTTPVDSRRLIEGITSHGIFTLDPEGCIESWTDSAESLYGYDPGTIAREHLRVLFANDEEPTLDLQEVLDRAKTASEEIEHWNKRADGSVFWATVTLSPLGESGHDGYVIVSQDTTEKKQYKQMLERQNDRLKEFTDIIAHDLRNPLNVIDGRLDLYRETRDDEHINQIEATAERMERLVEDLLRVARQGNVVTNPERVDLDSVTATAWEGTGNQSEGASLVYEPVPPVGADHDRLCELFENLFRNATEHGGPAVTVRVGPLDSGFYIEDDGAGIPPEALEHVFEHGFTTTATGSGYGLSVVRTITNAHGWDVHAGNGESGGARFEITGVRFVE